MEAQDITQHSSSQFSQFLCNVRDNTMEMAGIAERHVQSAVQAFLQGDQALAKKIACSDFKINALEVRIDEECCQFIALRNPVARDLRTVLSVIKAATDLERVGDEAEKIARLALQIDYDRIRKRHLRAVRSMGKIVGETLHTAIDAFARLDTEEALEVIKADAEIDQEYEMHTRHMVTFMIEDPRDISQVLDVLWCIKALERIADHSANLCEHVLYQVLGKDLRGIPVEKVEMELRETTPERV